MALFEQRLAQLEAIVYGSKFLSELAPGTPQPGDRVGFFNSNLNRHEQIEWSDFVGLAGSAGVTFDQTGDFWNVKVNGSTVFQVSKAGQTGQYADILNAPPLGDYQLKSEKGVANGYTPNDSNNKVPIVHIPDLPYVPTGGYSGTGQDLQDQIDGLDQAIILQNTPFDASTGVFPGGGTAQAGYKYLVSVSGTVDGVNFANGDSIIAIIDDASTTTYIGNWQKINNAESVQNFQQVTDQGATTTNEVESTNAFKSPQFKISNSGFEAILSAILTASRNISFQDKDGTVALLSDISTDADTLDGLDSSQFLRSDISQNGSNLTNVDADTLDGVQGSNYARTDISETFNDAVSAYSFVINSSDLPEITSYDATRTDITALVAGTTFGGLIEGGINGNQVIGIRANNDGDSFSIITNTGTYSGTYNDLIASFKRTTINFYKSQRNTLASGYTTPITLESLGDNDWITKKQFNDNGVTSIEGTFTPTLIPSGGGATYSYSSNTGYYIRTGKRVDFVINIDVNGTTGTPSGIYEVQGLPFTSKGGFQQVVNGAYTANLGVSFYSIQGVIVSSTSYITLRSQSSLDDSNTNGMTAQTLGAGANLDISGFYFTD